MYWASLSRSCSDFCLAFISVSVLCTAGTPPSLLAGYGLATLWRTFLAPAESLPGEDERQMIGTFVERRQLRPPAERGKPVGSDIRSWVVLLARMVGWRPTNRQALLGNEVLWRAYVRLQTMLIGMQTLRDP